VKPVHKAGLLLLVCLAVGLLFYVDVFSLEKESTGRKLWDNFMLFVNFGILVFLFIKYAKTPMMNFLRSERDSVEEELNKLTEEKQEIQSQRDAEADQIKDIDRIVEEIRSHILEMGKKEKEKIIQQGKALADKIIQDAKTYSENRIVAARQELSEEMVDMALSMARERLSKGMTDKDNDNLVNQFITNLQATKASVG
jgi:F-type H+-transporting ATPase subunit b